MKKLIQNKNGEFIYVETDETTELAASTNEDISLLRETAYRSECDPMLAAMMAYQQLGEDEKAAIKKAEWLKKREEIKELYPYIL